MATLTAVVTKEEDMYVAYCPETGTASQGYSVEQAIANLREATELYLEEFPMKVNNAIIKSFDIEALAKA